MDRFKLQRRQQLSRQLTQDAVAWLACAAGTSILLGSVVWSYAEPHLVQLVATSLSSRAVWYNYAVKQGGIADLKRVDPQLRIQRGERLPQQINFRHVFGLSQGTSPYALYWNKEYRHLFLRSGAIEAVSPHIDDENAAIHGFWIRLQQRDRQGNAVWVFADDRLTDTPMGIVLIAATLTSGLVVGTLLYLRLRVIHPLQMALAALPQFVTRNMDLVPESGNLLALSVCQQLNRFLGYMNASNESQRTLLRGLTHDLRGPLGRIQLRSEQLVDGLIPADELAEEVLEMRVDVEQLCELTNKLYAFADQLVDQQECRDVDIAEQLAQVVSSYNNTDLQLDAARLIVRLNPTALRRSLNNLIDNALEYGRPPVLINAERQQHQLRITVEDHGRGLSSGSELAMPRMPGAADRQETTHRGLGLGIVEQFCRSHGGSLKLGRGEAGGLRAELRLPLKQG